MVLWGCPAQRTTVSAVLRSREKAVPVVALHVLRHGVQRQRLSFAPETFPRAAALGIALSLVGHTHGG